MNKLLDYIIHHVMDKCLGVGYIEELSLTTLIRFFGHDW